MQRLKIKSGCTRHVILVGDIAIKIPVLTNGWELFLCGLLGNIQETKFSGVDPIFCPIQFSLWGRFLNVMKRAQEMSEWEFDTVVTPEFLEQHSMELPCEYKISSFGWLDGRAVCVDYGS